MCGVTVPSSIECCSCFMERKKNKTQICCFFFILSIISTMFIFTSANGSTTTSTTTITCRDRSRCPMLAKGDSDFQELEEIEQGKTHQGVPTIGWTRRLLYGPGSSPPRCTSKCGKCTPCKPVHVPVPPGTPVTAEYYPEAWRCKCGNKLYMP
ncbi:hypothetical protein S83_022572 [Arachis hypogaea]